jgi:hypothetical protein
MGVQITIFDKVPEYIFKRAIAILVNKGLLNDCDFSFLQQSGREADEVEHQ